LSGICNTGIAYSGKILVVVWLMRGHSFNINVSIIHSKTDINEKILSVHVRDLYKNFNKKMFETMQINQLAIVRGGEKWTLSAKNFKIKNKAGSITKYFSIQPVDENYDIFDRNDDERRNSLVLDTKQTYGEIDF
jgi:hypothetical protein